MKFALSPGGGGKAPMVAITRVSFKISDASIGPRILIRYEKWANEKEVREKCFTACTEDSVSLYL